MRHFIYSKINRVKSSEFILNVSKLTTGTTIAQIISIAMAPILYRIYDKEHYGALGLYMGITGVIGVFSTLQFLQIIMLEKEEDSAIHALWLNRIINIGFSLFTILLLIFFYPIFTSLIGNISVNRWLWMIPLGIFFAGQNEIFRVWANRKKEYGLLTFNAILTAVLTPILSISLGLLINDETGLFIGLLGSQIVPAIVLHLGLKKKYDFGFSKLNIQEVQLIFKKNKEFPIYLLPVEFVNRFSNQLPVFMLNHFSGLGAVGLYNLSLRILGLPISFIGSAIGSVFQQRASEDFHLNGNCETIFLKTFKSLLLLSVIPTTIILLAGPLLFDWTFGDQWREAGVISQCLILMMMFKFVVSPLSYTFYIKGELKLDFIFHLGIFITTSSILYIGLKYFSLNSALLLFSIVYSSWYLAYLIKSYEFSKGNHSLAQNGT